MSQRQVFRISDLSGGLNPDQNEVLIADNEASDILNFRIDKIGSLVSRQGFSPYESLAPSTPNLLAIGRWTNNVGANQILAATAAGELVEVDATYPVKFTGLSTSAEGMFLPVQKYLVYTNGTNPPVVYDGTTAATLGITAPATAPTLTLSSTGITGTYTYRYTYFSTTTGWESNPSPVSASTSPNNHTVNVALVAATHPYADSIRIYRTTNGGGVHLLLATIAGNSTTYADSTPDSGLTAIAVATNNNVPLNFENLAYHKGYLFGSIGNTLYWSRPLRINAFPALQFTEVPFEGNDRIVALRSFQDTLVIFGERNTVTLAGDGGNWSLFRQDVDIGCIARRGITEAEGALFFLSDSGIRTFPGFQQYSPRLTRVIDKLSLVSRKNATMTYVPEERSVWLGIGNFTWVVHAVNEGISRYNLSTLQYLQGGKDGFSLPLFISDDKKVVQEYGGTSDDGDDIVVQWRSKVFQIGQPEFIKFIRRIGAYASTGSGASVTITISDTQNSFSIPLASVGDLIISNWDTFDWDDAVWSSEGVSYFIAAMPAHTLIGRTMQVTINAESGAGIEVISPISIEYRESDRFLGAP